MRHILPPEQPYFEPYYHYASMFSPPECHALIDLAESKGWQDGSIGNGAAGPGVVDDTYRCVSTVRLFDQEVPWAFERLIKHTEWVNSAYHFDLHGLFEDIGIMRYDAPGDRPAGHYRWHQDFGGGPYSRRKISIVSLLSNPAEFEGGDLTFFTQGEQRASLNSRGDTVFFPAWTPHAVGDVTKGRRYSLVAWVSGPRFR